jgi:hypothetical protein
MSHDQLRQTVPGLETTLGPPLAELAARSTWLADELRSAWRDAAEEAACAYEAWRAARDGGAYAVYRAVQDRADAAQDALALAATTR